MIVYISKTISGGFFMKKFLSLILAFSIIATSLTVQSFAAETDLNYDDQIAPCYENLSKLNAIIENGTLGFVNCISSFESVTSGKTFVLTCYLQRTDGSTAWQNYRSKTETYTSKGTYTINKNWFAPSGYSYRTLTKLEVKNSSGTLIETVTAVSSVIHK